MEDFDLIVVGGGAAGFYGAIQAAEMNGGLNILILEKSNKLLSKVRVSGGGRCNVTHRCFDPISIFILKRWASRIKQSMIVSALSVTGNILPSASVFNSTPLDANQETVFAASYSLKRLRNGFSPRG